MFLLYNKPELSYNHQIVANEEETLMDEIQENEQAQQRDTLFNPPTKKAYRTPVLTEFGDLRDITLAPTPGQFESGRGIGWRSRRRV